MTVSEDDTRPATEAPGGLVGAEAVAALLLAMGAPVAQRLLPQFSETELKMISHAAVRLGAVPPQWMNPVLEDFAEQFGAGFNLLGSPQAVEDLLAGVVDPSEIDRLLNEPVNPDRERTLWEQLADLSEGVLAKYLMQEHPQTSAYVLNRVEPGCAATTLRHFPQETRDDLIRRMLSARSVTDAVAGIVEETLVDELLGGGSHVAESDRHDHLAKIMLGMDPEEIDGILGSLEAIRPDAVRTLKGMLFTFHNLTRLSDASRARVLEGVGTEQLVLALRGTEDEFRDDVLSVLSARQRRIVENELGTGQAMSQKDVRDARRAIAALALDLAARGEIALDASKEDAVV